MLGIPKLTINLTYVICLVLKDMLSIKRYKEYRMVIFNPLKLLFFLALFGLFVVPMIEAFVWVFFGADLGIVGEPR